MQALDGGITQVVCIAAGFDSRAYRFHRQGVQVGAPKGEGGGLWGELAAREFMVLLPWYRAPPPPATLN